MPEGERREILESLEAVDLVYIFDEDTPHRLLGELRPDVLVKGPEYRGKIGKSAEYVSEVLFPPWDKDNSSSDVAAALFARARGDDVLWLRVNHALVDWGSKWGLGLSGMMIGEIIDQLKSRIFPTADDRGS